MAAESPLHQSDENDTYPISGNGMRNATGVPKEFLETTPMIGDSNFLPQAILQYLYEQGMHETLASFERESGLQFDEATLERGALTQMERHYMALTRDCAVLAKPDALTDPIFEDVPATRACTRVASVLDGVHPMNITAAQFALCGDAQTVYTACADRTVRAVDIGTASTRGEAKGIFDSAVSCLAPSPVTPGLVLCGAMDASAALIDFAAESPTVVQKFSRHTKAITRVAWAPHGELFATASYDHTARLFRPDPATEREWAPSTIFDFAANVESLTFSSDGRTLICAPREDNFLYAIDVETQQRSRLNMNATGDTWVSFSALDVTLAPGGRYLMVSTDKSRTLLFDLRRDGPVRTFHGVPNEGLSQPRSCFDASGGLIYSTGQDWKVYVFSTGGERQVGVLSGHKKTVRDLDYSARLGVLVTASYDKTMRVWGPETPESS